MGEIANGSAVPDHALFSRRCSCLQNAPKEAWQLPGLMVNWLPCTPARQSMFDRLLKSNQLTISPGSCQASFGAFCKMNIVWNSACRERRTHWRFHHWHSKWQILV